MLGFVASWFGCAHRHCTFPITARNRERTPLGGNEAKTYIVCLDCGKEFPYDWQKMKVVPAAGASASAKRAQVA